MLPFRIQAASALLCALAVVASAHGDENMNMGEAESAPVPSPTPSGQKNYDLYDEPNYFSLDAHSGLMMAHIGFMILAWFFVLPIGKSSLNELLKLRALS